MSNALKRKKPDSIGKSNEEDSSFRRTRSDASDSPLEPEGKPVASKVHPDNGNIVIIAHDTAFKVHKKRLRMLLDVGSASADTSDRGFRPLSSP